MGALEELLDRIAIVDVLLRYGSSLDDKDWDRLESCFTPDAVGILAGGPRLEGYQAILTAVRDALAYYPATQHMISNHEVELDGDRARLRSNLIATHVIPDGTFTVFGVYREELVRTPEGWRIVHHQLDAQWLG
jgi:3-phenylpropionate/cinnamic acid dioxygenase small subunit